MGWQSGPACCEAVAAQVCLYVGFAALLSALSEGVNGRITFNEPVGTGSFFCTFRVRGAEMIRDREAGLRRG